MIEIKPTRKKYYGYKLSKVFLNCKPISNHSDVTELRINNICIKIDITDNGYIRIWSDYGNFINEGYMNSLSTDFRLILKKEEKV